MEGHGNGAEDIGQKSSKNREREIKDPAVMRNRFWLCLTKEEATFPSPLLRSARPATHTLLAELLGLGG